MSIPDVPALPSYPSTAPDSPGSSSEEFDENRPLKRAKVEGSRENSEEEGSGDETGQKPGKLEKQLTFVLASLSVIISF